MAISTLSVSFFDSCFSMARNFLLSPLCSLILRWILDSLCWPDSINRRRPNWGKTWKITKHSNYPTHLSLIRSIKRHLLNTYYVLDIILGAGNTKEIRYNPCPWNCPILFSRKLPSPRRFLGPRTQDKTSTLPRKDDWYVFMLGYENNMFLWKSGAPFYNTLWKILKYLSFKFP